MSRTLGATSTTETIRTYLVIVFSKCNEYSYSSLLVKSKKDKIAVPLSFSTHTNLRQLCVPVKDNQSMESSQSLVPIFPSKCNSQPLSGVNSHNWYCKCIVASSVCSLKNRTAQHLC